MNEDDVVKVIRGFISTQFPKKCPNCVKHFESLADYLRNTTHIGKPRSYDVENGEWEQIRPFGTFSMANCFCGNTLAIA